MELNKFAAASALAVALTLSGCAQLPDRLLSGEDTPEQSVADSSAQTSVTVADEDPWTLRAEELRQSPNLYAQHSRGVSREVKDAFAQGLALKEAGDIPAAVAVFDRLAVSHPDLSGPWLQLGDLALLKVSQGSEQAQKLLSEAKAHYQTAVHKNPHNYQARNRLAKVLREAGEFGEAEHQYQQAIASWPGFAPAYLNLGILYDLYLGKKAEALAQYRLFEALSEAPPKAVKGWIADLSRQLDAQSGAQLAEVAR